MLRVKGLCRVSGLGVLEVLGFIGVKGSAYTRITPPSARRKIFETGQPLKDL